MSIAVRSAGTPTSQDRVWIAVTDGLSLPREVAARYRDWKRLGSSSSGAKLFLAHDDHLSEVVFVKVVSLLSPGGNARMMWGEDVKMLQLLRHPRIIPMHRAIYTPQSLMIIMPHLTGGSMLEGIPRNGPLTEAVVTSVIRSVLYGLEYLHSEGLRYGAAVHPGALLLDEVSTALSRLRLGTVRGVCSVRDERDVPCTRRSLAAMKSNGLWFGSVPLLSPEEILHVFCNGNIDDLGHTFLSVSGNDDHDPHSAAPSPPPHSAFPISELSDLWSVGVLAFYLMTGTFPHGNREANASFLTLRSIVRDGVDLTRAMRCVSPFIWPPPEEAGKGNDIFREALLLKGSPFSNAMSFIKGCCERDPTQRLSAARALEHPWLTRDLEDQKYRTLPEGVSQGNAKDTSPQPLGRYAFALTHYTALCRRLRIKANSQVLDMLCAPGPWKDRIAMTLDLSRVACGSTGSIAVVQAILEAMEDEERVFGSVLVDVKNSATNRCDLERENVASSPSRPPWRLASIDLSGNDLSDEAVRSLVNLLMEHPTILRGVERLVLTNNPRITQSGIREMIRLLTRVVVDAQSQPQRSALLSEVRMDMSMRSQNAKVSSRVQQLLELLKERRESSHMNPHVKKDKR